LPHAPENAWDLVGYLRHGQTVEQALKMADAIFLPTHPKINWKIMLVIEIKRRVTEVH